MQMMKNKLKIKISALVIYFIFLVFFICKMEYYQNSMGGFPDESSQITYVWYLEETGNIIPEFREIPYSIQDGGSSDLPAQKGTNYLGHPPLYYHIMRLCGGARSEDGTIHIDASRMRDFSELIAIAGIILVFGIGYSRLCSWPMHLLYAATITSIPMLAYSSAGVNNDTLVFVGLSIAFLALLRLSEDCRDLLTYILLAVGIFITVLSKLTGGLILMVACVIYLIYSIISERSAEIIWNRKFLATLPLYVIVFAYYMLILVRYRTVQPRLQQLNPDFFYTTGFYVKPENRVYLSFPEYINYYWSKFVETWSTIHSHVSVSKPHAISDFSRIGLIAVGILPLSALFVAKEGRKKCIPAFCIYVGVLVAAAYQFYNTYHIYLNRGYMGGFQSRYYLCALPALAFLIATGAEALGKRIVQTAEPYGLNSKLTKGILSMMVISFTILLIYEDFIYTLLTR